MFITIFEPSQFKGLLVARELLEGKIGKKIDDEVWNKVVKKLRKQQHKERNALRLKRKVSNNKIISRRKKHKQKNFAIASTHSI